MKDFKNWLIVGLVVLCMILFSLKECGDVKNCPTIGDTTIVNIDTIWPVDTFIVTKWRNPKPADSVYVPFFVNVNDSNIDSLCQIAFNMLNYVKFYSDSIENDDMVLIVEDSVRGVFTYKSVSYKLKIPKEIIITQQVNTYPKWNLNGGLFALKSLDTYEIGPALGLRFKNFHANYSYGLFNKTQYVSFGVDIKLKKRKKAFF